MSIPRAEHIVYTLFRPRTLARVFLMWVLVTTLGTGVVFVMENPNVAFNGGSRAEASSPSWLADFNSTDFAAMPDARVAMDMQAQAQAALAAASAASLATQAQPILPKRIVIKDIGMDWTIENPDTEDVEKLDEILKRAVVHYPGSADLSGKDGNMLIFGHSSYLPVVRNKLYKAFNEIQHLEKGTMVSIYGDDGVRYDYAVTSVRHASAEEDSIAIATEKKLTLLTCDTFGKKTDRWIVEARPL